MALILCPECGREVSNQASNCPDCAYPISTASPAALGGSASERSGLVLWRTSLSVVSRIALGALLLIAGNEGAAEEAAIIGGLLIGASAIPAMVRGRLAWLRAGRPATIARPVEDRITAMDEHYRERIDQIEQTHTSQLTELEERIDFAERLLTKKRPVTPTP